MSGSEKNALVPLADGVEEIEAVCIIDTLRRADIDVTVAAVASLTVRASRGVTLVADTSLAECSHQTFDLIALPGGMPGAKNLADSATLVEMLIAQKDAGRLIGAICAAPAIVLSAHGLLDGVSATCYPGFKSHLDATQCSNDRVVVDGSIVTAQGPAVAIAFALTLVEQLVGAEKRQTVADAMLC